MKVRKSTLPHKVRNHLKLAIIPNCDIFIEGPTDATLNDFWRLIWQEHPSAIVMVTNLIEREKVRIYHCYSNSFLLTKGNIKSLGKMCEILA